MSLSSTFSISFSGEDSGNGQNTPRTQRSKNKLLQKQGNTLKNHSGGPTKLTI